MEAWQLKQLQSLSLQAKIARTERKIREWYNAWNGDVYVSFSGGKDSTVLLHIVRSMFPDVPAVFVDTGLEYPEIRDFVKTVDNVTWLKPQMTFKEVMEKYGYPVISKEQSCAISRYRNTKDPVQKYRRLNGWPNGKKGMISKKWQFMIDAPFKISDACCDVMKKRPLDKYAKKTGRKPMSGMMADESRQRKMMYMKHSCNMFDSKKPISWPLAIWFDRDVWSCLYNTPLDHAKIYDMGENRTGCMFCMFGVHMEPEPNRFQRMSKTHPAQWNYCINKLGLGEVLDYIGVPYSQHSPTERNV